jgi:hypothetical protein
LALTSNSDLYAAIRDEGINRVVKHIIRQRPSLFKYGTILATGFNPENVDINTAQPSVFIKTPSHIKIECETAEKQEGKLLYEFFC